MASIDWAVLGQHGGDSIESFIAKCLIQRYPDATRLKPGKGDKGIDIWRRPEGRITTWQIKKFTSPLTPSQWGQVVKSWNRFIQEWVDKGHPVDAYYLVTPWSPTLKWQETFDALTAGRDFHCQWLGEEFVEVLADDFPATYARHFKGEDYLENMVLQKAALAGVTLEAAEGLQMIDALAEKEKDLDEVRQLLSDTYHVDQGIITGANGEIPLPPSTSAGIFHRYTSLGNNRFMYQSLVPKVENAGELDPVTVSFSFNVEPGSEDEAALKEWQDWGVPFSDLPATVQQKGGPLADTEPHESLMTLATPAESISRPNLMLYPVSPDGERLEPLRMIPDEVTSGAVTNWQRIVAVSPAGVIKIELRNAGDGALSLTMSLPSLYGRSVEELQSEIKFLRRLIDANGFELLIEGREDAGHLAKGHSSKAEEHANFFLSVAEALATLQPASATALRMPDLSAVTNHQYRELLAHADVYGGKPLTRKWTEHKIPKPSDQQSIDNLREVLSIGSGAFVRYPHFELGDDQIELGKRVSQFLKSYKLKDGIDYDSIEPGEDVVIVPDQDDEMITAAVVDDDLVEWVDSLDDPKSTEG